MKEPYDPDWAEAKRRCRLNEEEVAMAKELGFRPKSLIKNIPASSEQWKEPVNQWVRALYDKRFGARRPAGAPRTAPAPHAARKRVVEFRNPEYPWPDRPDIPERVVEDLFGDESRQDGQCPKPGKRECLVPGCGGELFL